MSANWEESIARYRVHQELSGMAPRTLAERLRLVGKFAAWAMDLGILGPSDLTSALVFEYRRVRVQSVNARGRRDAPQSVNAHLVALRDFLRVLAAKGALPETLAKSVTLVKAPRRLPKEALSHAEVMKILERIPGQTPVHLRDRALLETLYSSGIRRQELIDLEVRHVDLDSGVLRIECGKGSRGRIVPLGREACEWLSRYLVSARPALAAGAEVSQIFLSKSGRKLDGLAVLDIVKRWAKAAGIAKTVSPHTFRRSCATGMIRNRANPAHVKELLGHEDWSSLSAYVRLEIADLKDAHRRFHPREASLDGPDVSK